MPRVVIGALPSLVTLPPRVALVAVTSSTVGSAMIGGVTIVNGFVVKVETGAVYVVPTLLIAKALNE
jgi:hypothetical protein